MNRRAKEKWQEQQAKISNMKSLHEKGFNYEEIGRKYGVSKQRVHQLISTTDTRYFRYITKEKCIYESIRKWMNENKVSIGELTRRIYGNKDPSNFTRTRDRLNGKIELSKTYIDKLLSTTNLTYEEAFKKE